jgi:hypothetical protein
MERVPDTVVHVATTRLTNTVTRVAVTRGYDWLVLTNVSVVVMTVWMVVVWVVVAVRVRGKKTIPKATPMMSATTNREAIVPFFMPQRVASRGVKFY